MEGRAIARPNRRGLRSSPRQGRWPLLQWRAGQLPGQTAANSAWRAIRDDVATFNGGPGNCPAKPGITGSTWPAREPTSLQWRAGQLPGQTSRLRRGATPFAACPFNGGPGNCPAKRSPRDRKLARSVIASLQWRAGQLPGQTPWGYRTAGRRRPPSMEGRAIARPNAATP